MGVLTVRNPKKIILILYTWALFFAMTGAFSLQAATNVIITVKDEPHLDGTFEVSEDGFIDCYGTVLINIKGRTTEYIKERVEEAIMRAYPFIDNPVVEVAIQDTDKEIAKNDSGSFQERTRKYFDGGQSQSVKELKPTYRISPHDELAISVFGETSLDKKVRVSEEGTISYPLIGTVYIQDLTVGEAIDKMEKLLEENYFVNPQVSILITEYSKFSVLGEVNRPGTFELKGALTVVDALVLAEGPKDSADLSKVKVIRSLRGQAERVEEYVVDFNKEGRAFYLKPLDRVVINPKGKIYILGEVRNPGMYYITEKEMTLTDAIAFFANGINPSADTSSVEIVRKENGKDRIFTVDLEIRGHDFILKEQDRITVQDYGNISVFGQVKRPGRYPFKKGLTVIDVIALAEGFTDVAAKNSVKVIRKDSPGEKAIKVPVGHILTSGDTSRDVELLDGDSVVVPESWF
jgi:polysaccharide biosynthesis/export protein